MKGIFLILFVVLRIPVTEATELKTFTTDANVFFSKHVENGSVAYAKIKAQISGVESLYKQIGEMSLTGADENEIKSFYINAYNIIVIYWVAKHYPLKSPLDNSGFFDKVKHIVAGEPLTLNALEIKKLLQPYKDARFHFALACAAKSCPPLASFAYTPAKVNQQLDERTVLALNNKEWIKVYPNQKKVELSKIFEWYKADFTTQGLSSIEWINKYRNEKIPNTYSVGYYEYNWELNEKK